MTDDIPRPPSSPGAWALGILLAAALALGWVALGGGLDDPAAALGPPTEPSVQRVVDRLAEVAPEVVVAGNSQAYGAVDPDVLGEALDLEHGVVRVTFGGAHPRLLYRFLKHRVLGAGHRPRVLVLPMAYEQLVSLRGPNAAHEAQFADLLALDDPVLAAKGRGGWVPPAWWTRVSTTWTVRKQALIDRVTHAPLVGWGVADPDARLAQAQTAVMGDATLGNQALDARMIPVVEPEAVADRRARRGPRSLDESLLPELVDLARGAGAHLVVVSLPQRRASLQVGARQEAELAAFLEARGAGYVDLDGLEVGPDEWLDDAHIGTSAAARFSRALADALVQMQALGDGPLVPLPRAPRPVAVTRAGDWPSVGLAGPVTITGCHVEAPLDLPPALSDTGLRDLGLALGAPVRVIADGVELEPAVLPHLAEPCSGVFAVVGDRLVGELPTEGLTAQDLELRAATTLPWFGRSAPRLPTRDAPLVFVAPGTAVVWALDADVAGEVMVAASAVVAGEGAPTLDGTPLSRRGVLWTGTSALPDPRRVRLAVPPDGPWLVVRQLVLAQDGARATWAGRPGAMPDALVFAGDAFMRVEAPDDAPVLARRVVVQGRRARFGVPAAAAAAHGRALVERLDDARFRACTPFELVADDARVPGIVIGRTWTPDAPVAVLPDEVAAAGPWQVRRVADRVCRTNVWVFPGDTVRLGPRTPGALHVPAGRLEIRLTAFPVDGPVPLRVQLVRDGVVQLDHTALVGAQTDAVTLGVTPPFEALPRQAELVLSTPEGSAYVLVRSARLLDAPAPPVPDVPATPAAPVGAAQGTILASYDAALAAGAVDDAVRVLHAGEVAPRVGVVAADGRPAVVLAPRGDGRHVLCLPRVPATTGLAVDAEVRMPQGPGGVRLELKWFAPDGAPLREGGRMAMDVDVVGGLGAAWAPLGVQGRREGAGWAQACLIPAPDRTPVQVARFEVRAVSGGR